MNITRQIIEWASSFFTRNRKPMERIPSYPHGEVFVNGLQDNGRGGGFWMFTDKLTGSTFCVEKDAPDVFEKLREVRARFKK